MLLDCPECGHTVSDRAHACPSCGFPVAEHLAEVEAKRRSREEVASRARVGEVDCVRCEARGFWMYDYDSDEGETRTGFEWCSICRHTGRVALCRSAAGYYAVHTDVVTRFLAGDDDLDEPDVVFLGTEPPPQHRYPKPGKPR